MHLPEFKFVTAVIKFKIEEDPSGIHPTAQLPIIMHIKTDCMGAGNTNDKSD